MKIQNYLFLSIFSLAGFIHCLCSSDTTSPLEKERGWYCLVAYSEDILGDSFIEQNNEYNYFNNDVAKVIDSYLPKKELKALYLSVPYVSKFPHNPILETDINIHSIIKNALVLIKNPIDDIYVFKGFTTFPRYGGWAKIASGIKDLDKEITTIEHVLFCRRSFLNQFHSKPHFNANKMDIIRLTWMMCNIAKLDKGCLNLHENEVYPRKEAYEKVLYPAYIRMAQEQVVGSSLTLATMGVLSRLKGVR